MSGAPPFLDAAEVARRCTFTQAADAVEAAGHAPERLPSGAGHDAVQMAALTDVAMLFVRCEKGISHNPAEAVEEADVAVALDVLERFLGELR